MNITLNGKIYNIEKEDYLINILHSLNINPENIIAEINGEIYTKEMFAEKLICENDVVELVKFVGGG